MNLPDLPFSGQALALSLNLMTICYLLPAVVRPPWGGWWRVIVTVLFVVNVAVTYVNLKIWLHYL